MATIPDTLNLALRHHQAGRLPEAEALYRQILQAQPDHADALHLLGVIAYQVGQHQTAVDFISRAITLNPAVAEFHNSIGEAFRALGRIEQALTSYRSALTLKPDLVETHYNLGFLHQHQGNLEKAAVWYRRTLSIKPDYAAAHNDLGNVLMALDKVEEAVAHYRHALTLKPAYVEAIVNLGNALKQQGMPEDPIQDILSRFISGQKDPIFDRNVLSIHEHLYVRGMPRRYLECACQLLRYLAERSNRSISDLVIVEIGSMSSPMPHSFDEYNPNCCVFGHSTVFWARTGATVHTVDMNPGCRTALESLCREHPNLFVHTCDGCGFLKEFGQPIDLLYLDAWDVQPCSLYAEKHAEAYEAACPRLAASCIVSIDDTDMGSGGKGRLVFPMLIRDRFKIVAYGRQAIAVRLSPQ